MTTSHYTPQTTEDWLESEQGRTDFLNWLAGETDADLLETVRINLIGWAPYDRLITVDECASWIYELHPDHPAAQMLHTRFVEYWVGTGREHDRFHRWTQRDDILCGGCWS